MHDMKHGIHGGSSYTRKPEFCEGTNVKAQTKLADRLAKWKKDTSSPESASMQQRGTLLHKPGSLNVRNR